MKRTRQRGPVIAAAALAAAGLLSAGVATVSATAAEDDTPGATTPSTVGSTETAPPLGVADRGADVPFQEIEAEDAATNGTLIGPDRTYGELPSEASGRRAVTLDAGQHVEFTLPAAANALVLRYSLPDSEAGTGRDESAEIQVEGSKVADLPLTSRYGWYYGTYPFTNTPGDGDAHHFYDESRTLLGETLPEGTKVRVVAGSEGTTVDLADFELVADAAAAPTGSLDVVNSYGADPTGRADATAAIQKAVNDAAAQGKAVWLPEGTFRVDDHLIVDDVTVAGAGPWRTVLTGEHVGVYGKYGPDGGPART